MEYFGRLKPVPTDWSEDVRVELDEVADFLREVKREHERAYFVAKERIGDNLILPHSPAMTEELVVWSSNIRRPLSAAGLLIEAALLTCDRREGKRYNGQVGN